ncbi:MAG: hypothetical protein HY812_20035 [Planctomycetes bacterium]|nr:hypothetical protein [Planctomycetota bacterium]
MLAGWRAGFRAAGVAAPAFGLSALAVFFPARFAPSLAAAALRAAVPPLAASDRFPGAVPRAVLAAAVFFAFFFGIDLFRVRAYIHRNVVPHYRLPRSKVKDLSPGGSEWRI